MRKPGPTLPIRFAFMLTLVGQVACAQVKPTPQALPSCESIKGLELEAIIQQTIKTVKGISQSETSIPLEHTYHSQMDRPQRIVVNSPREVSSLTLLSEAREVKKLDLEKVKADTLQAIFPKIDKFKGALIIEFKDKSTCEFKLTFMELSP